jgi:hypothetical protein
MVEAEGILCVTVIKNPTEPICLLCFLKCSDLFVNKTLLNINKTMTKNEFLSYEVSGFDSKINGLSRGMLDSDGSVAIRWEYSEGYSRFKLEVSLGAGIHNKVVLEYFKNLWNTGNIHGKLLSIHSFKTLKNMLKVFISGPLFSHQSVDIRLLKVIIHDFVNQKRHLKAEGQEIILDLKYHLHNNNPSHLANTRSQYEQMLNLSQGSSNGKGDVIYQQLMNDFNQFSNEKMKQMINKELILSEEDKWYITGLTLGDGSFFISFGIPRIIPNYTITTNLASSLAPEFCIYGLTNNYKKASKVGTDACRVSLSSVKSVSQYVIPHFEKYPIPVGAKKESFEIFKLVVQILQQYNTQTPPFDVVKQLVDLAYFMNSTPKNRLYSTKEEYLNAYEKYLKQNKK